MFKVRAKTGLLSLYVFAHPKLHGCLYGATVKPLFFTLERAKFSISRAQNTVNIVMLCV